MAFPVVMELQHDIPLGAEQPFSEFFLHLFQCNKYEYRILTPKNFLKKIPRIWLENFRKSHITHLRLVIHAIYTVLFQ